jgi:hypothetical protein
VGGLCSVDADELAESWGALCGSVQMDGKAQCLGVALGMEVGQAVGIAGGWTDAAFARFLQQTRIAGMDGRWGHG